jgi:hypothetical protein
MKIYLHETNIEYFGKNSTLIKEKSLNIYANKFGELFIDID